MADKTDQVPRPQLGGKYHPNWKSHDQFCAERISQVYPFSKRYNYNGRTIIIQSGWIDYCFESLGNITQKGKDKSIELFYVKAT